MRAMTSNAARWTIGPRSLRRISPAIGWLGPLALSRPTHAFAAQVEAILAAPEELRDELAGSTVPTLVMVGNQDILTPRGDAEELAERIPTAELVVISGAAHGFMIEHATTFNRILLEFLGRAEGCLPEAGAAGDRNRRTSRRRRLVAVDDLGRTAFRCAVSALPRNSSRIRLNIVACSIMKPWAAPLITTSSAVGSARRAPRRPRAA